MKWIQRKSNLDCQNQPLAELIRDELDEKQCERLATHLDDCETCQQRLTVLAGDSRWWLDAGRWLDPAMGDIDSSGESLEGDSFTHDDVPYFNAEQELLASGFLNASEKDGVIGTLGRYEVQSVIGAGGTGIVLKAIDVELNRTVAINYRRPWRPAVRRGGDLHAKDKPSPQWLTKTWSRSITWKLRGVCPTW